VLGVVALRREETCEGGGKLVIHQEFHEVWRTT
jgi:hypothetical protein